MIQVLIGFLCLIVGMYSLYLLKDLLQHKDEWLHKGTLPYTLIGMVTNFLDTLGIGSFAVTTIIFNWTGVLDDDRKLPGTMNVGHAIPIFVQALIFLTVIEVDALTLYSLIAAAILGALVGSRFVVKFSEKRIQMVVGIAMCITALIMIFTRLGWINLLGQGNTATGLTGIRLWIGIIGNFILGSLMSVGVGLYPPCMAMLYMLGLNPLSAFPIMMASCAGLMPGSSVNFIHANRYDRGLAVGLLTGGIVGVFFAARLVVNFPIEVLQWFIAIVVFYAGVTYIRKARTIA